MQARILVCEDERFVRWALSEHLRGCGYDVFEASNGLEALHIIERSYPDVILLDLNMPKLNGLGVIEQLKQRNSDIPVFVISGFGQAESNTLAQDLGVSGFIKKPFRLDEIDVLLNNTL